MVKHFGGDSISTDSLVLLNVGGFITKIPIEEIISSNYAEDGYFSFTEYFTYKIWGVMDYRVELKLIDPFSNSLIMDVLLQDGASYGYGQDIGKWHFDEGIGVIAYDSTFNNNDGTIDGALWVPGILNYALSFNNFNNSVIVQDSDSLDANNNITIEAWLEPLISDVILDSFEYDENKCIHPDLLNINNSIYAIFYEGDGDDGTIKTLEILESGDINSSVIDTFEFDTDRGEEPDVINVYPNVYAIVYRGDGDDGWVKTVKINDLGGINNSIVDMMEYDKFKGKFPDVTNVYDDVYAIAYSGDGDDGWVKTVEIQNTGFINNLINDTLEFDKIKALNPKIHLISGNIYALVYCGDSDDGWLVTVKINNNGDIEEIIDSFEFDVEKGGEPDIINISGDIYAVAYRGKDDDGFIKTIEIAPNGTINDIIIDFEEFDNNKCFYPNLIFISEDTYAIAYMGDGDDGWIRTYEIDKNGLISNNNIDSLEFDVEDGKQPNIINIFENIYAIAYTGKDDDGFIKTIEISNLGNISETIIDSFEFDVEKGGEPDIINISGDIYAVAYRGKDDDGFIKTIEISQIGYINNTVIDAFEYDTVKAYEPAIINISQNFYAIAYKGDGDDGWLKTIEININGIINNTVIDSAEFDIDKGKEPCIINVIGDTYAIAIRGDGDDGWLKTLEINQNGNIISPIIESFEFDVNKCIEPKIIKISSDKYGIIYEGDGDTGILKTIEINTDGVITDNVIDTLIYDTEKGNSPDIIHINNNKYGIVYQGDHDYGMLKTIEIISNGEISDTIIDTLEFDTNKGLEPEIIHVTGDIYAIAYKGDGDDGWVKTIEIKNNGLITDTIIDSFEYDVDKAKEPEIIKISNNLFAISYKGDGDDGWLKTIVISSNGIIGINGGIIKEGAYGILSNSNSVSAMINNNWISGSLSSGWNYVVLTYDQLKIRLYVNSLEIASKDYVSQINVNDNNLLFGYSFYNRIDEVGIYSRVFSENEIIYRYNSMKP
jgi:hypothetical protein